MNDEERGNVFNTVDAIKTVLEKCETFEGWENGFRADEKKLVYEWMAKKLYLGGEEILENVTDVRLKYFPKSQHQSVQYRIEINGEDEIRGYVFLKSLAETEG